MKIKNKKEFQFHRFIGVSLSGGKSEKDALAAVEYYPEQKKLFLSHLISKLKATSKMNVDEQIVEYLNFEMQPHKSVSWGVPLSFPKCVHCELDCPGYEKCKEPDIEWLRKAYQSKNVQKKPKKIVTPYTERCAEFYINHHLEEKFQMPHACGANLAPLSLRTRYLTRQCLSSRHLESYAPLVIWRVGRSLGIQKSYIRRYKHAVDGQETRAIILEKLSEKNFVFLYMQDFKQMSKDLASFEAFIIALSGYFEFLGLSEKRPKTFPKSESWLSFPEDDCF